MAGPSKPIPGQTAVVNPRGAAYLDNLNSEEEMGHRMGTPLRMKGNKDKICRLRHAHFVTLTIVGLSWMFTTNRCHPVANPRCRHPLSNPRSTRMIFCIV